MPARWVTGRAAGAVVAGTVALAAAGCGGGGKTTTDQASKTDRQRTQTQTTPRPSVPRADVQRCLALWNTSVKRARKGSAQAAVATLIRRDPHIKGALALFRGPKVAERASPCLLIVTAYKTQLPPFSPQQGQRTWTATCDLVAAREIHRGRRRCSPYRHTPPHRVRLHRGGTIQFQ